MCTKFPIKWKIFWIFHWECLTWVILGRNFLEKTISMFEIGTLQKQPPRGCSKFTGEHPCRSAISIKLQSNIIQITLRHGCSPVNLVHIFRTPFLRNTQGWLLLYLVSVVCYFMLLSKNNFQVSFHVQDWDFFDLLSNLSRLFCTVNHKSTQ